MDLFIYVLLQIYVKNRIYYRTHAIITPGLYTFYPLFEVHLCTVTFGLMYGQYSKAVSNQERVIMARVWYLNHNFSLSYLLPHCLKSYSRFFLFFTFQHICSRVSKGWDVRGMSWDNLGLDVPLSLCPGTKKFPCPAVPLSRDKRSSKNPGTNSSVPGRPCQTPVWLVPWQYVKILF